MTDREAFEKHAKTKKLRLEIHPIWMSRSGEYIAQKTQEAWEAWRAATKNQDAAIKAAKVEALRDAARSFGDSNYAMDLLRMAKEIEGRG
jgi:hypothetical protein